MTEQNNLRKNPKKPLYYKKSKAAKEDEENNERYEIEDLLQQQKYKDSSSRVRKSPGYNRKYKYIDNNDEYGGDTEDLLQPKQYRQRKSPSRNQKSSKYNREYEYADSDDEYDGETEDLTQFKKYRQYPFKVNKSPRHDREYEYTNYDDEHGGKADKSPQRKQYKQNPSRIKKSSGYNREYEYIDYGDEYAEDLPHSKQNKQNPSRIKKGSRYNREYEYTDFDDKNGGRQYNYNYEKEMYDSGDEVFEYTTEDTTKYRRHPGRTREYYNSRVDTEDNDESDSDCLTCTSRMGQRSDYTSEYPSEYQREEIPASRHRNMHGQSLRKRKVVPSEADIERSPHYRQKIKDSNRRPYHQEYEEVKEFDYRHSPKRNRTNYRENPYHRTAQEVYVARAPDGHTAFTLEQQNELEEQTSGGESEMQLDDDDDKDEGQEKEIEESGWKTSQSQYQVFAANTGENHDVFRKQQSQNPRETLLSITDYDQSLPMVTLKNTNDTKPQGEDKSIVYLPLVVRDDTIKLPNSKVVHAGSILRTSGNKAEKPLETNINVYLAADNEQGNIFQQAQRKGVQEITRSQNIQIFATQSTHTVTKDQKPSVFSKIASKIGPNIKSNSKSEYPVQKSYINVVPSKPKLVEQKGSKISIKSGTSKTSVRKKHGKNLRKIKSDESGSAILSVINPTTHEDNQSNEFGQKDSTIKGGELQKQQSERKNLKKKPTIDNTTASTTQLTKQSTVDRPVTLLKQPTLDKNGMSESTTIITIKGVPNGEYEESKNVFARSETDLQPQTDKSETALPKKKGLGSYFFNKKESKIKSGHSTDFTHKSELENYDPSDGNPDVQPSPSSTAAVIRRQKSKDGTRKPKKSHSKAKIHSKRSFVEFSNKTEEFRIWKVLSFDSSAFAYIYQVIQYFLGLSIHGTLMEILRNSKQSD